MVVATHLLLIMFASLKLKRQKNLAQGKSYAFVLTDLWTLAQRRSQQLASVFGCNSFETRPRAFAQALRHARLRRPIEQSRPMRYASWLQFSHWACW